MENKDLVRQFLAGLFFIVGIVLTIFFVLIIGKNKGFAQKRMMVPVVFYNVGGLSEGAPTLLSGVNVGNVSSIDFLDKPIEGRAVKVTLSILQKYKKQLQKNVRFAIRTEGVLGEKLVEIYAVDDGTNKTPDYSRPVIGEDPFDVQDMAAVFAKAAESFTNTSNKLSDIDMAELAQVMTESSTALLETSRGLNDVMDQFQDLTFKTKRIIDRIEQRLIEGQLFSVF